MTKPAKTLKAKKLPTGAGAALVVSDGPPSLLQLVTDLRSTLDDVRNTVGDHFNWEAADIGNATVREFGEKTEAMCRMLLCENCGGMAVKDKTTHFECACGRLMICNA